MATELSGNQSGLLFRLDPPREPQAIEERREPQKTERAIDPAPPNRNTPDRPTDMSERENKNTRDHAGLNDPDISNYFNNIRKPSSERRSRRATKLTIP